SAGVTYTLWVLNFHHARSAVGTDGDPSTCDHADQPMGISIGAGTDETNSSYLLTPANSKEFFTFADPSDQSVTWNAGCPTTAVGPSPELLGNIALRPSYPNPARSASHIAFTLAAPAENRLQVFDAAGHLVRLLHEGHDAAGDHEFSWDGMDSVGRQAQAGVYFVRLEVNGQRVSEQVVRVP